MKGMGFHGGKRPEYSKKNNQLTAQYGHALLQFRSGEPVTLFQDDENLKWGIVLSYSCFFPHEGDIFAIKRDMALIEKLDWQNIRGIF